MSEAGLAFWTIAVGIACNVSCALVGCYLVLRRMSLLGDAISHAVLPGIALGFLFSGQINGMPIVLGAMSLGVLTTFLTHTLHSFGKVPEDASMGVAYTSLFAVGVIMISRFASQAHLDAGCVLYGLIEFVPLETVSLWGLEVPRTLVTLGLTMLLTLAFVLVLWKELKIASFDPALATAIGLNATLVHYLLMAMVAGVTVASFEAVGSILVVAMLIVPGATAHLLTDRLGWMLIWSVVIAIASAVWGYYAAVLLNTSVAGMMAVAAGVQFFLAVLLAPRHGVVSKWVHNFSLALRIACEDIIGMLYRAEESAGAPVPDQAVATRLDARRAAGGWRGRLALRWLREQGRIRMLPGGRLALTSQGREAARSIVRSHRLWESYLQEHFDLPLDHLHEPASRMEHYIDPRLQSQLESELQAAEVDPHGRAIPRS